MRRTDAQQGFSSAAADADVIVVGCGLAGLSAALAAAQRRARVVLFDSSSDLFATNDVADRLYFNAVDPERQGDLGITDSPELFYRQTLAAGGGRADPALVKILCYQAYIALKWLEGFGVGFENKVRQIPGGVYPRTCVASDYRAGRLAMMNAALDAGVTVLQGLTFRELVLDAQGRVAGVAADARPRMRTDGAASSGRPQRCSPRAALRPMRRSAQGTTGALARFSTCAGDAPRGSASGQR